jgi:hypothetical protein
MSHSQKLSIVSCYVYTVYSTVYYDHQASTNPHGNIGDGRAAGTRGVRTGHGTRNDAHAVE